MNKLEATESVKSGNHMQLVDRDTTGNWFDRRSVWLDTDGTLVMSHPTEPHGTVDAPDGDHYRLA